MRRSEGLTLFEVLAAVVVLGMLVTVLAGSNIQGLRAEGTAARRLEASLVADQVVAELEAQQAAGTPAQVGRDERETPEGLRVQIDVAPLELELDALPLELQGSASLDPNASPTLLAKPESGAVTPLRHVRVAVIWDDGSGEDQVVRDTFLFDAESVNATLAGLGLGEGPDDFEDGDENEAGEEGDSQGDGGSR